MMDSIFLADLFELLGSLIIAYTVIAVHHRILHEHKVDNDVFKIMKKEQLIAGAGMVLLILGFCIRHVI